MPHKPRIDIPGLVYHVYCRAARQLSLFASDHHRQGFLRLLSRTQHDYPFRLHAFCLMDTHYHLVLQTMNASLAKTMHVFQRAFATFLNRDTGRAGHVFDSRYQSIPVETDSYFLTVCRYVHLNPVRAGIVRQPEHFTWSDYATTIAGNTLSLVDSTTLLNYFPGNESEQRARYRRFVEDMIDRPEPVTEAVLRRMRYWGNPAKILPTK